MAKAKNTGPKPRNDAYTGLLAISFLSLVGATVLMAMDASDLGTPPAPFKVDAPGSKTGTGEAFKRTDTNKIDTTPNPEPKAADPMPMPAPMPAPAPDPKGAAPAPAPAPAPAVAPEPKAMSLKPRDVEVPAVVVPPVVQVGAVEPAADVLPPTTLAPISDPTEPPVTVKPFVPPM